MKYIWDYNLPKNWKPRDEEEWIWYLERKINYDDWQGINEKILLKYFKKLKLDHAKKILLETYFKKYAQKK